MGFERTIGKVGLRPVRPLLPARNNTACQASARTSISPDAPSRPYCSDAALGGELIGPVQGFADMPAAPGQPPVDEANGNLVMPMELPILGGHRLLADGHRCAAVDRLRQDDGQQRPHQPRTRCARRRFRRCALLHPRRQLDHRVVGDHGQASPQGIAAVGSCGPGRPGP